MDVKMKEQIINQIVPFLITSLVAILVATIKVVGKEVIAFLRKNKEVKEQTIKTNGHEDQLRAAKEVWHIVEEKFRIIENVESLINSKADEFDKMLLNKVPSLKKEDLEYLRQTVAGEFNKGKQALLSNTAINVQLQAYNLQIQQENDQLKQKLTQLQTIIQ
ncbi:cobalt ABC transporter permease [Clostridium gasigenes]|uniref:cobalt ABC transporter permease n=1 Tax=Clostridium gasigenes TaxID=94869 RepID=UPI00162364F9|nr:cobalt ABC transporter permease [Clostridium gasigenes]MBB6622580.1 cobalt ABC transporter permease [Clostridium gasigenes]